MRFIVPEYYAPPVQLAQPCNITLVSLMASSSVSLVTSASPWGSLGSGSPQTRGGLLPPALSQKGLVKTDIISCRGYRLAQRHLKTVFCHGSADS